MVNYFLKGLLVFFCCAFSLPGAQAREFSVGTLAYSYAVEGFHNIFIQVSINDNSAVFFDRCNDTGNTYAGLYKNYWQGGLRGPYWFGGLIYVNSGSRAGTSATGGLGYEYRMRNDISIGSYLGYAAGAEGQRYGVFDITLAYTFKK